MKNIDIDERIKNFNFTFVKYIDSETKELGNKVILFSALLIIVLLYKNSISEVDFTGFKIEVDKKMLVIILFVINLYYILQFRNAIKIDKLLAKMPDDLFQINLMISNEIEKYGNEVAKLKEHSQLPNLTENDLKNLNEKIDLMEANTIGIGKTTTDFNKKLKKILAVITWNRNLNIYFPYICYIISILILIIVITKKYWV